MSIAGIFILLAYLLKYTKKYSGQGSCLARNFGRHSTYRLSELLTVKQRIPKLSAHLS
jgi:hypothetical protein